MQTKQCTRCETTNPAEARFCMRCGAPLQARCARCQAELPPEARFCPRCGQPAAADDQYPVGGQRGAARPAAETPALSGERRIATALLADVKGSTALAERVDMETWVETMNRALQLMGDSIHRYGGEISQYRGDGLLAFFGAHVAHEDDTERAVLAALDMQDTAQRFGAELLDRAGIELQVRVGLNTGEMIATTVGRMRHHAEETAMGRAIALAARMESAAEPGTVLVTENTYCLVAPLFEWQPLGQITVKGVSDPVTVYRPTAHRAPPGKGRGIAGRTSPLVGRSDECLALRGAVDRVAAGVGGIVTLVGEAGIGKSRLVAEARRAASAGEPAPSVQWTKGRCLSYTVDTAYQVWLDVLRSLLGIAPHAPPAAAAATLRAYTEALGTADGPVLSSYLARVLSLPLDGAAAGALRSLDAAGQRAATYRAIETVIERAAQRCPLIVVCEDLHWADPTSIYLLVQLMSLTERVPLLLICVLRPETEHDCWRIVESASRHYRHRHTALWLERLSLDESRALIRNLLPLHDLPPSLCARILAHAEGNPFYLEELLRTLIDRGTGRYRAAGDAAETLVPDTLYGLLASRIDRLPQGCKRVLQIASVAGRDFTRSTIAALTGDDGDAEPGALDRHLITLQQAQMIRERTRLPEASYTFEHHLTQEVAYRSLLGRERRRCHRRVAETLETRLAGRGEEGIELLAYHWQRAEEPAKAVHYLIEAGDRARQLGASLEAVRLYRAALPSAGGLASAERGAALRRIHERLGDVYLESLSRHDEALEQYRAFLALAEADQDRARGERKSGGVYLLRGDLDQAQERFEHALSILSALPPLAETSRVQFGLAYLFVSRNDLARAARHAYASLEAARAVNDIRGTADAYRGLGLIYAAQGQHEQSHAFEEQSLALYRDLGDLMRTAQACNNLGNGYRQAGQMREALAHLDEGLEIVQRIGDTRDEALLLTTKAELLLDQGQTEGAIAHLERALPLAQRSGVVARRIETHLVLGTAYEEAGRAQDALQQLQRAARLGEETHHSRFAPRAYLGLARVSATGGADERAAQYVAQAEEAAGPEPSELFRGALHRCRAHLAAQRGDWETVVQHLEASLGCLERSGLPVQVCSAHLDLGRAYASRGASGDRERACAHLRAALPVLVQIDAGDKAARVRAQWEAWGCSP